MHIMLMWQWIKISQTLYEKKTCDSPKEWMLLGLVATARFRKAPLKDLGLAMRRHAALLV